MTIDQPVVEMPAPQVRERRTDGLPGIPIALVLLIVLLGSAAPIIYGPEGIRPVSSFSARQRGLRSSRWRAERCSGVQRGRPAR